MTKVRSGEDEVVIKDGERKFHFGRDEEGQMRINSVEGYTPKPGLMERLKAVKPETCALCLRADVSDWIWKMLLFEILDEEDFL